MGVLVCVYMYTTCSLSDMCLVSHGLLCVDKSSCSRHVLKDLYHYDVMGGKGKGEH